MKHLAILLLVILAGCKSEQNRAPASGEAYVGPASLGIRQDITPQSAVVATVNRGERLEVLQRRRRFIKIRTARGVEGWADERQLLRSQGVSNLRKLSGPPQPAPCQGASPPYGTLTVN